MWDIGNANYFNIESAQYFLMRSLKCDMVKESQKLICKKIAKYLTPSVVFAHCIYNTGIGIPSLIAPNTIANPDS